MAKKDRVLTKGQKDQIIRDVLKTYEQTKQARVQRHTRQMKRREQLAWLHGAWTDNTDRGDIEGLC